MRVLCYVSAPWCSQGALLFQIIVQALGESGRGLLRIHYMSDTVLVGALVFKNAVPTFFCPGLVLLLDQQVAGTFREEGQHAQLQHHWKHQEGKEVVPPGLLQSKQNTATFKTDGERRSS